MIANLGVGLNEKSVPALRMARKSGTAIAGPAGPPTPPLSLSAKRGILISSSAEAHRCYRPFQATPCAAVSNHEGRWLVNYTLLSHAALPQDAYTKYTVYTTYEYVRVLVSQLIAIIQISYLKIGRLSFSPCSLSTSCK